MHLEEKADQIVDLFARLGGVLEHPQHPLATGLQKADIDVTI